MGTSPLRIHSMLQEGNLKNVVTGSAIVGLLVAASCAQKAPGESPSPPVNVQTTTAADGARAPVQMSILDDPEMEFLYAFNPSLRKPYFRWLSDEEQTPHKGNAEITSKLYMFNGKPAPVKAAFKSHINGGTGYRQIPDEGEAYYSEKKGILAVYMEGRPTPFTFPEPPPDITCFVIYVHRTGKKVQ